MNHLIDFFSASGFKNTEAPKIADFFKVKIFDKGLDGPETRHALCADPAR